MLLNGSQILMEILLEQGVDTIFGYPGGAVLKIYDAVYEYSDRIRHITTAHEQGAAHAADGYARASGKTGVVFATSGPGATNLVTGIAAAYMDSVPMVAITGNVATGLIGKDSFQEVYIAGITMPITKHNYVVQHVEELADILRNAFRIASEGRKGPVLVDIPQDVSAAVTEYYSKEKPLEFLPALPYLGSLNEIADAINTAHRPLIYIGGGAAASEAGGELLQLMRRADIPAVYTMMAAGTLRDDEPLNLGLAGMHGGLIPNRAIDEADLLIALGTRFSDRVVTSTDKFARSAAIIQLDIDESEINKNIPVKLSAVGNIKNILQALSPLVSGSSHTQWLERIDAWRSSEYVPNESGSGISPSLLMKTIGRMTGEDGIFVTDVGQHQLWAAKYLTHVKTRHFLTSGGLGAMGYGYGAAIGAKTACPDKRVIHITGDGSFHMNLNEACTAVTYEIPVISIILNNSALGMVRQLQGLFCGRNYSCTNLRRRTDYPKVAEGFGLKGYTCTTLAEFEEAFEKALAADAPVWIECVIDRDEAVLPMIPAGKTVDDIIME